MSVGVAELCILAVLAALAGGVYMIARLIIRFDDRRARSKPRPRG